MNFGEWLTAQRMARGWSLGKLARAMRETGLTKASPPYIQQVERGEINPSKIGRDKLEAFAVVFDMSVNDLLGAAGYLDPTFTIPPRTLAALQDLGIPDNVASVLLKRSQYLTDNDWNDVVEFAADRAARRAQEQRGRQRGADPPEQGIGEQFAYQHPAVEGLQVRTHTGSPYQEPLIAAHYHADPPRWINEPSPRYATDDGTGLVS